MTVFGAVEKGRSVPRSGAREGDWIGVTGTLGDASIGLSLVMGEKVLEGPRAEHYLVRHFCPPFRGPFAKAVATKVTAMMDLSDGVMTDLPRLCKASAVRAELETSMLPLSPESVALGLTPEKALTGGEDYELLFTVPPARWPDIERIAAHHGVPVARIGSLHSGQGLRILSNGKPISVKSGGWRHFS
jgi:thiamine-monophosphate kinase